MKEEVSGKLTDIIYHNESNCYTIGLFETEKDQFCVVGTLPRPLKGRGYKLLGEWKNHPKYGEQFAFSSFEELAPTTSEGIAAFLCSGVIKGVGPMTAASIVARFGEKTLDILRDEPDRLTEVPGIGQTRAVAIAAAYAEHTEYAQTVLDLSKYDISPATALKLYKTYGSKAVEMVLENPYQLISDIYGVGFTKADEIARKIGFNTESPFRIRSYIMYYLNDKAGKGHTYMPKAELLEECAEDLDVTRAQLEEPLLDLTMGALIFMENLQGEEIVMLSSYHRAERRTAGKLYELCNTILPRVPGDIPSIIARSERENGMELSPKQIQAVISSLNNGVSVITGGPGTGKTTIINTILSILDAAGLRTALAAPTGRAAKRMSQATGQDASTIHRLLEYYYSEENDSMKFGKTAEDPLDYDCIIIDEMSMVDIILMDGLLQAIQPGTRLILVGDADQLPPVGAGSVLSDILRSGTVHAVRLTDIFRQAQESMIVVNAHRINHGEYPSYNQKDTDFFMIERKTQAEIVETIKDLCVRRLPAFYKDVDPMTDIQVLTPVRKGPLGNVELNKELQSVLNPPSKDKAEKSWGGRIYREGDRVMQNKNNYQLDWRDLNTGLSGTGVFNGDLGIIQSVDNEYGNLSVLYDDSKLVVYDFGMLEELETAFAMTVHKSQGSEFPVMIMPVHNFPAMLANRNLLYTAITRAKTGVVLVGQPRILCGMVDNDSMVRRNSGLAVRLTALWGFEDEEIEFAVQDGEEDPWADLS